MRVQRYFDGVKTPEIAVFWCPRPESNRHDFFESADFKSAVSTDFTTRARAFEGIDLQCNKTKADKNPNTRHPISLKKPCQWTLEGLPEMEI